MAGAPVLRDGESAKTPRVIVDHRGRRVGVVRGDNEPTFAPWMLCRPEYPRPDTKD